MLSACWSLKGHKIKLVKARQVKTALNFGWIECINILWLWLGSILPNHWSLQHNLNYYCYATTLSLSYCSHVSSDSTPQHILLQPCTSSLYIFTVDFTHVQMPGRPMSLAALGSILCVSKGYPLLLGLLLEVYLFLLTCNLSPLSATL